MRRVMAGERAYFFGIGKRTRSVWKAAPMRRRVLREKLLWSACSMVNLGR